jgi:hypothetical protein
MKEASEFLEKLELEIAKIKTQLSKLKEAKPIDEMTPDDVYNLYPELKAKIDDDFKNDRWTVTDDDKEVAKH